MIHLKNGLNKPSLTQLLNFFHPFVDADEFLYQNALFIIERPQRNQVE